MKKYIVLFFIINISPLCILAQQSSTAIQIIPAPQQLIRSEGQFVFNEHTQIAFDQANAELKNTAGLLI